MAVERELIEFTRHDLGVVLARLEALADGSWINLEPIVAEEDLDDLRSHAGSRLLRVFSARGRAIPFATVVAAPEGLSVGLEHGRGARVLAELRQHGVAAPGSWRQEQDHPRRGVVYVAPRDESAHVVLHWLLDAGTLLSDVPIVGEWTAVVATPR